MTTTDNDKKALEKYRRDEYLLKHGIAVKSEFVPWSQSRNKGNKDERGNPVHSLNWRVTVLFGGREVLTTDYSGGIGHCPSYAAPLPVSYPGHKTAWVRAATAHECETGKEALWFGASLGFSKKTDPVPAPSPHDVLYSLVSDASVLDCGSFEEWASDFGYDADSRSAEKTYRACLEIALKLRNGFGEKELVGLQRLYQDY
jgi:hypothetical protein